MRTRRILLLFFRRLLKEVLCQADRDGRRVKATSQEFCSKDHMFERERRNGEFHHLLGLTIKRNFKFRISKSLRRPAAHVVETDLIRGLVDFFEKRLVVLMNAIED